MASQPVDSATCALVRGWDSREVYLAHRVAGHRAFPDTWVFPGGKVASDDHRIPVQGLAGLDAAFHVCAVRELFEETGVLVAAGLDPACDLAALRREHMGRRLRFADVLHRGGALLRATDLAHLGTKTTPPFAPLRFRNRFCMAALPPGQEPEVWPGELDEGRWLTIPEALAGWERMELRIVPPVLILLEAWGDGDAASARARLEGFNDSHFERRLPRMRFAPDVHVAPLRTPTLPPATTTNTYIVGARRLYVVDPATPEDDQKALLHGLLGELIAEGARVEGVILTHEHPDHVGAVKDVMGWCRVGLFAHPVTLERLAFLGLQGKALADGARLPLGEAWDLEALHTPGHSPGHLCLYEARRGSLIAGDMVSTVSTIIIDPQQGGDMGAYMDSLHRLRGLGARTLYPAHGPPTPAVAETLDYFISHREGRQRAFLAALTDVPVALGDLLPRVYADVPPAVHPLALRSLRALAQMCVAQGRAATDGDGRYRRRA